MHRVRVMTNAICQTVRILTPSVIADIHTFIKVTFTYYITGTLPSLLQGSTCAFAPKDWRAAQKKWNTISVPRADGNLIVRLGTRWTNLAPCLNYVHRGLTVSPVTNRGSKWPKFNSVIVYLIILQLIIFVFLICQLSMPLPVCVCRLSY